MITSTRLVSGVKVTLVINLLFQDTPGNGQIPHRKHNYWYRLQNEIISSSTHILGKDLAMLADFNEEFPPKDPMTWLLAMANFGVPRKESNKSVVNYCRL